MYVYQFVFCMENVFKILNNNIHPVVGQKCIIILYFEIHRMDGYFWPTIGQLLLAANRNTVLNLKYMQLK